MSTADLSGVIEQEFFRLNESINPQEDSFSAPYYGQSEPVSTREPDKSPTTSASQKENNSQSKEQFTVKKADSDSEERNRGQKRTATPVSTKSENTGTFRTEETGGFGSSDEPGEGETGEASSGANSTRSSKKPRLVWTAELHSRFMNAVNHLGVKNAVPKTILQLMNVEGMTRENVASHLQKYRLYLKRCAGLPPSARLTNDTQIGNSAQLYPTYVTPAVVLPSQHMAMAPSMVQQGQPMHSMVQSYMPPAPGGMYATDIPPMFTGHRTPIPSATAMGLPYPNRIDSNPCYYAPYMGPPRMVSNYPHSTMEATQPYYGYAAHPSLPGAQHGSLRDQAWDGYPKPIYRSPSDPGTLAMHPQSAQSAQQDGRMYNRVSSLPTSAVVAGSYPTAATVDAGSQYRPLAAIGSPVSDQVNGSTLSQTSQNSNMGLALGYSGEQQPLSQSPQQYTWSGEASVGTYSQPNQVNWNGEDWSKKYSMDDPQASGSLKHW